MLKLIRLISLFVGINYFWVVKSTKTIIIIIVYVTLCISTYISLIVNSSWFGYIFFMIILRGLIVSLIYLVARTSGEFSGPVFTSKKQLLVLFLGGVFIFINHGIKPNFRFFYTVSLPVEVRLNYESEINIVSVYGSENSSFTTLIILILIIAIVFCIKLCRFIGKPLRTPF